MSDELGDNYDGEEFDSGYEFEYDFGEGVLEEEEITISPHSRSKWQTLKRVIKKAAHGVRPKSRNV